MESQKHVAVIAPAQLGSAFMVLLQSAQYIRPLANATDVETLLPILGSEMPDVVLLYLDEDAGSRKREQIKRDQVIQSKAAWPDAFCIAVVESSRLQQEVESLGADVVLPEGITVTRLLATIDPRHSEGTYGTTAETDQVHSPDNMFTLEDQLKLISGVDLDAGKHRWRFWKKAAN